MAVSQTLSVTEVSGSVNASSNTSQVNIVWKSTQTGESWNGNTKTAKYYISINGAAEKEYTVSYALPKASTVTILNITSTVPHKDNGSGIVKVRTWMDTGISAGVVEKTRSLALTTITKSTIVYDPPYIAPAPGYKNVICERCTEDGVASDTGTYLHVKGTRNYSKTTPSGNTNTCSVRCRYKPESGSWSHGSGDGVGVLLWTDTSTNEFDIILPNIVTDIKLSYMVELNIIDDTYAPSAMVFNIPSEAIDFELRDGGKGVAFGKHAITENLLDCAWDARFHKGISIKNESVADFVVEQGTTGIWYWRKWYSGAAECWCRNNVDVNVNTAWGSALYYGVTPTINYPFKFAEAPICQITCEYGTDAVSLFIASTGEGTNVYATPVMLCRTDAKQVNCNILYHAHGRWK